MKRIHIERLRTLLQGRYYRNGVGVAASFGGGWFVRVPK